MDPRFLATLCLAACLLVPPASAGTPDAPEVDDPAEDGGVPHLDIRSLWVDTNDTGNLTFHLTVSTDLPAPAKPTSHCSGSDCAFTSLSWRIIFRVLGPDGKPLPQTPDYNRSYVAYRHGPDGTLVSPVGTFDSKDVLTLNGSADVTVTGSEIVLRIARSNPAVAMPLGPAPGSRIDRLYAYDSPQACAPPPANCAAVKRTTVDDSATPPSTTQSDMWDRAPDVGYANATDFPAPPPAAPQPPVQEPAPTAPPAPPAPPVPPEEPEEPAPEPVTMVAVQADSTTSEPAQESPALAPGLALLVLAALAGMGRRRC